MAVSNDAELEQFIMSHCTVPGCRVGLHDEEEALVLGRLLKDKRLLVRAEAQSARLTTFAFSKAG
jgi:hypothetical protein